MGERKEKSLATLTKKFIDILKTNKTVDLNVVVKQLSCSKKRRIYDVSNVLEGIGLIKRTRKNHYTYYGKQNSESNQEVENLEILHREKESLKEEEKEIDNALSVIKSNFESLFTNKSYLYLKHNDLIDSFGNESTILVAKDYKLVKLFFEKDSEDSNLLNNVPQVYINGYLIRPVQLKMINSQKTDNISEMDKCTLETLEEVINDKDNTNYLSMDQISFNKREILKQTNQLLLFKTGLRQKKFIDHDRKELESLADNVLALNKYQGKSKFQYISDHNLVFPSDYENPGLISMHQPAENEYAENYSIKTPSVHDLYDFDVNPLQDTEIIEEDNVMQYDDEESYIVEELDEEMLNMLQ